MLTPLPPVDPEDLQRVLDDLTAHHGDLEVLPADPTTGSVPIIAQDGVMFRFTTQARVIRIGRATRRAEGRRDS